MSVALSVARGRSGLRDDIDRSISLARQLGRPALLTRVVPVAVSPDPLAFLAECAPALGGGSLWWQPSADAAFAGAGSAWTIRADGPGRFGAVSAALRELRGAVVRDGEAARFPIIGGFAYTDSEENRSTWLDFADAMFVVPTVVLQIRGSTALVRVTLQVDPSAAAADVENRLCNLIDRVSDWSRSTFTAEPLPSGVIAEYVPPRNAWEASVATAVALIRQSMLDKVVLAREARLRAACPFSPLDTLTRLLSVNAEATYFALQAVNSWFLGATPERLVRLEQGLVDVTCLAGSIGIGRTPSEQNQLAGHLLASEKDREEHEIVVRSTMSALDEVCEDVQRNPGTPHVLAARSVQHLETPIRARMASAGHVLDLVERLHPTPAVGGFPRDTAAVIIRELEEIERGWYAGPFGWVDLDGCGEFAVAIRSALLSGRTASVYAGCGIVAESNPSAEFEEAGLKMQPMLAALGAA